MKIFKIANIKTSQSNQSNEDFGGYFSGSVPDYAASMIGTQNVDASQISSTFGKTSEALKLVNSFASDALLNIAFVFNFAKGGAYGVYVPSLDRAIKTKSLQKQLESKGYKIVEENDLLTAYPTKDDKTPEQIEQEIENTWQQINAAGGTAIGVNVQDILSASKDNASKIISGLQSSGKEIPPQVTTILNDLLSVYHLAATIVHEASHSKGGDEGKAQADEGAFRSWAQGQLNEKYKSELISNKLEEFYTPLDVGGEVMHAKSKSWYKKAQFLNYKPSGSDLEGRFNGATKSSEGLADWSMLAQKDKTGPIENRLSNEFMFPLEQDINQANDSIEAQLRKQTKNDYKNNIHVIMEEMLFDFHNESASYMTTEELLEDNRPKPLMVPIRKASRMVKEATVFGWYNNLSISDGSTIPGLSDRVMAWEDRDESFSQEEDWIEQQSRYNPEYDVKGMYYRWIEPHFQPQLWTDMTNNLSNTHPAKRFANNSKINQDTLKAINILMLIQKNIGEKMIGATRLVVSDDIAPLIKKFFSGSNDGIETKFYDAGNSANGDKIISAWIFSHDVPVKNIHRSEHYFQNKINGENIEEVKEIAEQVLGTKNNQKKAIEEIISAARDVCNEYSVKDLYITGTYARERISKENPDVRELDFMCTSFDKNLKLGGLIAKKLGISAKMHKQALTLSFSYKGIRVDFQGDIDVGELIDLGKEKQMGFSNALIKDLNNRDFTINMLAYNVANDSVEDPLGCMEDLKSGILKTYLDPSTIIKHNPSVILRALKLNLKYGFEIDRNLQKAMINNAYLLFDGRYSEGKLLFMRESVKEENAQGAETLFDEFALGKIKNLGKK